jgi:hypothetical protein
MSADRYAEIQRLPVESHHDALREVMHAGERLAHLSKGYRPEPELEPVLWPTPKEETRLLAFVLVAVVIVLALVYFGGAA